MRADAFELSTRESIELLRRSTLGRLCTVEHDYPVAVPVTYRLIGRADDYRILVRAARDSMLSGYRGHASLEVEDIQVGRAAAWSVIARGVLRVEPDPSGLPDPSPIVSANRRRWMTLDVLAVSGRRFEIHAANDRYSVDWQTVP